MISNSVTEKQIQLAIQNWKDRKDFLSPLVQFSTFYTFEENLFVFKTYLSLFVEDIFCRIAVLNFKRNLTKDDYETIINILFPNLSNRSYISVDDTLCQVSSEKEPHSLLYIQDSRLLVFLDTDEDENIQARIDLLEELINDIN